MTIKKFSSDLGVKLYPKQLSILNNFYKDGIRELVAVLGRRSGKDTLSAIIVLKELDYLLSLSDPYKFYGIARGNPIFLQCVCASVDQARILMTEIQCLAEKTEWGKREGLTNHNGTIPGTLDFIPGVNWQDGVITVSCNGCRSEGLLGRRIFCLLLNEVASFQVEQSRIYSSLTPATADFRNPDTKKLESKIISISSPRGKGDMLHNLFSTADDHPTRYAVQYPTWEINPMMTEEHLRQEFKFMSDQEFATEFGAEFFHISENKTVSLRLPSTLLEEVKQLARERAYKEQKDISHADIVREAVELYLPFHRFNRTGN